MLALLMGTILKRLRERSQRELRHCVWDDWIQSILYDKHHAEFRMTLNIQIVKSYVGETQRTWDIQKRKRLEAGSEY